MSLTVSIQLTVLFCGIIVGTHHCLQPHFLTVILPSSPGREVLHAFNLRQPQYLFHHLLLGNPARSWCCTKSSLPRSKELPNIRSTTLPVGPKVPKYSLAPYLLLFWLTDSLFDNLPTSENQNEILKCLSDGVPTAYVHMFKEDKLLVWILFLLVWIYVKI